VLSSEIQFAHWAHFHIADRGSWNAGGHLDRLVQVAGLDQVEPGVVCSTCSLL